ncbi:MAG: hypothetical protein EOP06_07605 [Proteobacteria bacterium]|nr:MAG: hypothetical protein EOP06_07605 [Pseudomonadota bacterium]
MAELRIYWLILSFLCIPIVSVAEPACPPTLSTVSTEILKKAVIQEAKSDVRGFCHRNLVLRSLFSDKRYSQNLSTDDVARMPTSKIEKQLDDAIQRSSFRARPDKWSLSLMSTPKSRRDALQLLIRTHAPDIFDFSKPRQTDSKVVSLLLERTSRLMTSQARDTKYASSTVAIGKFVLCAEAGALSTLGCRNGLNLIAERLHPKMVGSNLPIVRPDLYADVLLNQELNEGLRLAALKVQSRLKDPSAPGDVYSDLVQSFRRTGATIRDADEAAWKVLGLIATGGQNIDVRMKSLLPGGKRAHTMPQNMAAISLISVAMTALDSERNLRKLPLYSYPSSLVTTCDNAKPYHFWLSAFNARELVLKDKLGETASRNASFATQKAYQLAREDLAGNGGSRFSGILRKNSYSPASQIVRTDLAYAAAGAEFGASIASSSKAQRISVDRKIGSLLAESRPLPKLSEAEEDTYRLPSLYQRWKNVFAPNQALGTNFRDSHGFDGLSFIVPSCKRTRALNNTCKTK